MTKHLEKLLHGCERAAAAGNIPVRTERTCITELHIALISKGCRSPPYAA